MTLPTLICCSGIPVDLRLQFITITHHDFYRLPHYLHTSFTTQYTGYRYHVYLRSRFVPVTLPTRCYSAVRTIFATYHVRTITVTTHTSHYLPLPRLGTDSVTTSSSHPHVPLRLRIRSFVTIYHPIYTCHHHVTGGILRVYVLCRLLRCYYYRLIVTDSRCSTITWWVRYDLRGVDFTLRFVDVYLHFTVVTLPRIRYVVVTV